MDLELKYSILVRQVLLTTKPYPHLYPFVNSTHVSCVCCMCVTCVCVSCVCPGCVCVECVYMLHGSWVCVYYVCMFHVYAACVC